MRLNTDFDFSEISSSELATDRSRRNKTSDLAGAVAERERLANQQRFVLFGVIVAIVCMSIVAVGVFVTLLGLEVFTFEAPVAIAFISAMAVQSFVLIGLLVRGLFMGHRPVDAQSVS